MQIDARAMSGLRFVAGMICVLGLRSASMPVGDASRGRARRRDVRGEGRHSLMYYARPRVVERLPHVNQGCVGSVGREGQVRVRGTGHGHVSDVNGQKATVRERQARAGFEKVRGESEGRGMWLRFPPSDVFAGERRRRNRSARQVERGVRCRGFAEDEHDGQQQTICRLCRVGPPCSKARTFSGLRPLRGRQCARSVRGRSRVMRGWTHRRSTIAWLRSRQPRQGLPRSGRLKRSRTSITDSFVMRAACQARHGTAPLDVARSTAEQRVAKRAVSGWSRVLQSPGRAIRQCVCPSNAERWRWIARRPLEHHGRRSCASCTRVVRSAFA
eukprot:1330124-Pleurochrysis_carterae.AAC.2